MNDDISTLLTNIPYEMSFYCLPDSLRLLIGSDVSFKERKIEQEIRRVFGGKLTVGSGNKKNDGDLILTRGDQDYYIEVKFRKHNIPNATIRKAWTKARAQARRLKRIPILVLLNSDSGCALIEVPNKKYDDLYSQLLVEGHFKLTVNRIERVFKVVNLNHVDKLFEKDEAQ